MSKNKVSVAYKLSEGGEKNQLYGEIKGPPSRRGQCWLFCPVFLDHLEIVYSNLNHHLQIGVDFVIL